MIDIEKIRAETPGIGFSTHLLACGSSLMPQRVVDVILEHTQLEALMGGYEAENKKIDDLNNQRRRWVSAQIYYLRESFFDALKEFFMKGNIDYLDKSLQMALIPRVLLLGLIPLMLGLSFFLSSPIQIFFICIKQ